MATVCLVVVLFSTMLVVQVWAPFSIWMTLILTFTVSLFTGRAYTSITPYGWA
jgi:hypothetical protein